MGSILVIVKLPANKLKIKKKKKIDYVETNATLKKKKYITLQQGRKKLYLLI